MSDLIDQPEKGAVIQAAHLDLHPSYWPEEIRRTGAQYAKAKEAYTLLKDLKKPTMIRLRIEIMDRNPGLSKSDAEDRVYLTTAYREYTNTLAEAEKNKALWESRYAAAKAEHESARTYEASRRAASYRT